MATLVVGDKTPKNQYESNADQVDFPYTFPIFEDSDLKVFVGSSQKTLSADYTVTNAGNKDGGSVVFGTPIAVNEVVTIYRDIPVARTTDYATGGALMAENLNNDLDKLVMMTQQNEAAYSNTIRVDQFDIHTDLTLPPMQERLGKTLAFDEFGNPVAGPSIGDVNQVSVSAEYITLLAEIQNGVQAEDVLTTLADNIDDIQAVGSIGQEGLEGIVANQTNIDNVSTDLVGNNTLGAVAGKLTEIETVALRDLDIQTVAARDLDIEIVADNLDGTNTIGTVAGIDADIQTVAARDAAIGVVANRDTAIETVYDNIGDVQSCHTNIQAIQDAVTSAGDAAISAAGALANKNLSKSWADSMAQVNNEGYSAKYWANEAQAAASGGVALNGLSDVDLTVGLVDNVVLVFDSATGTWKPQSNYMDDNELFALAGL